jgi:hypothetical protein
MNSLFEAFDEHARRALFFASLGCWPTQASHPHALEAFLVEPR